MDRLGKIDRGTFEETIAQHLGADRADVAIGPTHGVDFGVLDVGDRAVVVATDPISILPRLGFERAGAFALDVVLADVAVSGVPPTHLTISLALPPHLSDADLATLWDGIATRAEACGVSIVGGHTARYPDVAFPWIGAATALGVGAHDDIVRPDGASPGDSIVVARPPGTEVAALLAALYPDRIDVPTAVRRTVADRLGDLGLVRACEVAVDAGPVTALHDATEGGLVGALAEMAAGAGLRFDIDRASVPSDPDVEAVCNSLDLDPWQISSTGTLVGTVSGDPGPVVSALGNLGIQAATVGRVRNGSGVHVDGEALHPPDTDPSWAIFEALARAED